MDYDDATLETKVNEEKVFSLRELAFINLKMYKERNFPENISFELIEKEKKRTCDKDLLRVIDDIENEYKNIDRDLKDIFRIFNIEIFLNKWKNVANEYEFYESDVKFLCNVLNKYRENKIWKKIKKVDNSKFGGFVNLYRQEGTVELLDELSFVVDGFAAMCEKKCEGKDAEINDFINTLLIYTQLRQIKSMEKMKEILFSLPTLSLDDIYSSPAGILLEDYQKFLYLVQDKLSEVISSAKKFWEQDVEERKEELDEFIIIPNDDEYEELFNRAIEHSHILKNDNEIENHSSSKDRLNMSKKREENEQAIEQLPEKEKEAIMQMIDCLYNGH